MRYGTMSGMRAVLTVVLLAACGLVACTGEQILIGQWYSLRTPPAGECPSLLWRFVVNPERSIDGHLLDDTQHQLATLQGRLDADDSFRMTAANGESDRPTTITGQFTSVVSTISIHGDAAGRRCDGRTFEMRLGRYFASQGGGGGGR